MSQYWKSIVKCGTYRMMLVKERHCFLKVSKNLEMLYNCFGNSEQMNRFIASLVDPSASSYWRIDCPPTVALPQGLQSIALYSRHRLFFPSPIEPRGCMAVTMCVLSSSIISWSTTRRRWIILANFSRYSVRASKNFIILVSGVYILTWVLNSATLSAFIN